MSVDTEWDIESYRTSYESEEHWVLKRDFMEAHKERIAEDRLVCLAQVFANIELLGCRYPDKTMEEVSILARDVGQDYKERKKTKLQRTFVKASDAAGAKVKGTIHKRKNQETQQQNKPLCKKPMTFVKASEKEETKDKTVAIGKQGSEAVKTTKFQTAVIPSVSERQFKSEKYKKAAMLKTKNAAVLNTMNTVTPNTSKDESTITPALSVTQSGRGIGIGSGRSGRGRGNAACSSSTPQTMPVPESQNALDWDDSDPLSEFVIVRRKYHESTAEFPVLNESSDFSRIPVNYKWAKLGTGSSVTISINGVHIASGTGDTKKGARETASVIALEELSKRCYTLKVLKAHTSEEEVSVGEVADGRKSSAQPRASGQGTSLDRPLEDTSMGSKLLKMMGWTGGGLGKEGTGITEPIRPPEVCGRGGLGHNQKQKISQKNSGTNPQFRNRIIAIVRDFTLNSGMEDLAFSPDFTKEQRAEIHKIARRFKLKSTSHGSGDTRYLVLSRRFSVKQLIFNLCQAGPTDKYELIPPQP